MRSTCFLHFDHFCYLFKLQIRKFVFLRLVLLWFSKYIYILQNQETDQIFFCFLNILRSAWPTKWNQSSSRSLNYLWMRKTACLENSHSTSQIKSHLFLVLSLHCPSDESPNYTRIGDKKRGIRWLFCVNWPVLSSNTLFFRLHWQRRRLLSLCGPHRGDKI